MREGERGANEGGVRENERGREGIPDQGGER